jgi:signal transduction histidine kinase
VLWACLTALLLALCAVALSPDLPGPRTRVVKHAKMFDHRGQLMGDVELRHTQPGSVGEDTVKRFQVTLPEKTFEGPEGLMLTSVVPNLRALIRNDAGEQSIYSSYAADIRAANRSSRQSTSELEPHLVKLPSDWRQGNAGRAVVFEISGHDNQTIDMDQVWYGPYEELGVAYKWRYLIKWVGVHVLTAAYFLAAIAALAFWNSDRSYRSPGWFAGFCGFASLAMATGMATESPPVSWPLYLHFAIFFVGIASLFLVQFIFEKTGVRSARSDKALLAVALFFALAGVLLYEDRIRFPYALLIDFSCIVLGCVLVISLVQSLWRRPEFLNCVLLGGVGVSLLFGLHSVAVGWWTGFYATSYSLQFAPLPITLTMGWVVIRRYARMKLRTDALNLRLTRRVAQRETELQGAFESIAELQQDEAVRLERERFMRDMHDGLGAQLITSLRMAQRGALSHETMRDMLQECLDELRFSIESLKPTADDFLTVLGNYRYRLQPRLEAAGMTLKWRFDEVPAHYLSPQTTLQTLRILNEAVSNALKHAHSSQLDITGTLERSGYAIRVRDYGSGFHAPTVPTGEGLRNMALRAQQIDSKFTVESLPAGTTVGLVIPLSGERAT